MRAEDATVSEPSRRFAGISLGLMWLFPVLLVAFTSEGLYWRDHAGFFRATWWSIYEQVRSGALPVLNVWHPSGIPHEMSTNHALYTPMSLLLFAGPFERTYDLFVLEHFALLATGVYVFARQAGVERVPAVGAGLVTALAGPVVAFENLVVGLQGMAYTPWLLAAILHARRKPGLASAGLTALALAVAAQAVMPEIVLIDAAATVWILVSPRFPPVGPRALATLALGGALGLAAALVDLVPLLDAMRGSERWVGFTDETRQAWSVTPAQLLDLLVPGLWALPELSCLVIPAAVGSEEPPYLATLYLGTAIPVAVAALSRHDRRSWLLGVALLAFLAVAMGPATPLHGWLSSLPLLRSARYPVKYMMVVAACVAVLGGMTLANLERRRHALILAAMVHLVVMILLVVSLHSEAFELWYRGQAQPFKEQAVFEFFRTSDVAALGLERVRVRTWWSFAGAAGLFIAAIGMFRAHPRRLGPVICLVLALDLLVGARFGVATAPVEAERLDPVLEAAVNVRPRRVFSGAVPPIPELPGRWPFESAMLANGARGHLGWRTLRAFAALDLEGLGVNRVQAMVQDSLESLGDDAIMNLFARAGIARYFSDRRPEHPPAAEALDPAGRLIYILDVPEARPYLAAYPRWVHGDVSSTAAVDLLSLRVEPSTAVLWNRPLLGSDSDDAGCEPHLTGAPARPARQISFEVDSTCSALVVLQEIRLPRWRVEIDGRPAETLEAEVGYIALLVPKGRHRVRVYYDSLALKWMPVSLAASGLALAFVIAPALLRRRRGEGRRPVSHALR